MRNRPNRNPRNLADFGTRWPLAAFGLLWGAALAVQWVTGGPPTDSILVMAIIGVGFSTLAWLSTRRVALATAAPSASPAQLLAVTLLLVGLTAYLTWGRGFLVGGATGAPGAVLDLLEKLLVFVAAPVAVFRAGFGYGPGDLGLPAPAAVLRDGRWKPVLMVGGAFVAFQAVFGQGARPIMQGEIPGTSLVLGLPLVLGWLVLEVGVVEELFFRALVQDRISAALANDWAGILGAALLFGLAHAPGLYLRGAGATSPLGTDPSALAAVAYAVAVVAVAGVFLGVLWARTRSLVVVALVHALGDLLPNAAPLLRTLGLA